ncbi:gephyrin-like molybdotransferase Glp [Cribrihabitans pelagius]|uniref:molybdopterin-binding protein n=1 Tax=Cribrihabitans pelagius TaxID=1765746 RepID=UPI003B59E051
MSAFPAPLFDTVLVADWTAGKRRPKRESRDAIWLGAARSGIAEPPVYCRSRQEAEAWLSDFLARERAAGRRVLAGFDFPFACPRGFARRITGSDSPFALWAWLEARIQDSPDGSNNRFDVASELNRAFPGEGPFWGKPEEGRWPDIPYRKSGITYAEVGERRQADLAAQAASSCFQLFFNPTVGSQMLMGLPVLQRLRQEHGVAVWPFEGTGDAPAVFAELWPGLIEPAVKAALAEAGPEEIRDRVQVSLLSQALSRLTQEELAEMLGVCPPEAKEEGWILGTGHKDRLNALAGDASQPLAPPPLGNDCFALPAGVDWTPVDEALARLRERLRPVTGQESVPLAQALGRVLAADAVARRANPPLPNTAVDGYGFRGPLPEGPHVLPLVEGRAAAGVPSAGEVPAGHAIRVLTGAALPAGVDTVVLEEDVNSNGCRIALNGPLKRGANTRKAGEDVREGTVILSRGRVVTPADLALASACGLAALDVHLPLRVGVLSTGDELVEAGATAAPGQIYDANRPMLLGLIRQLGFTAIDLGRAPDNRAALRERLDAAAGQADAILTSGGASAGDEDHVSALLREAGALQHWRIALKPGRPLALGMWQGTPVFGLPGNPVAALVCTLIFARPAMGLMAGAGWREPQGFEVPAAFAKRKKPGRREYLRARIRQGRAEVFTSEGSGRISGLSWAEGLVELGDGAAEIRQGDPVRFIPYGSFAM